MRIRDYTEADLARLEEIYETHKEEFELPDPFDVRVVIRRCLVDQRNKARIIAFGRVQLNAYLLVDGKWKTPEERLQAIGLLEQTMIEDARAKGFDEVTAQVSRRFGERLKDLGWIKSPGVTWNRKF